MADYIPARDGDFEMWARNFSATLQPVAESLAIGAHETQALDLELAEWQESIHAAAQAEAALRRATTEKRLKRRSLESSVRQLAKRVHAQASTTEDLRRRLGLSLHMKRVGKRPPPTEAPTLLLDLGTAGRCKIHFGTMPTNKRLNRKPENAASILLEYRTSPDSSWHFLAVASSSPHVHELRCSVPTGIEYRAHYLSPTCECGPTCEPVAAVIQAVA